MSKMREKYDDPVLTPEYKEVFVDKDRGYLWLVDFNKEVFRYFYGLRKFFKQDKRLSKLLSTYPRAIKPHITVARFKPKRCRLKQRKDKIDLVLSGDFYLVKSYLTNKGPVYKIHPTY